VPEREKELKGILTKETKTDFKVDSDE